MRKFSMIVGLCLLGAVNTGVLAAGSDAYEQGRRALDRAEWSAARDAFRTAVESGENVEASMYWKAYAESKMKNFPAARETIARLKAAYPESQWVDDAEALALEMSGPRAPGKLPEDEELKLYALQMLMMNDPERAEPLLEEYIKEGKSDELRDRAMFILLQHPDAANSDLLNDALSQAMNIPLKMSAIRLLGVLDDEKSRALLDKVYRESEEDAVKHMIIQAYMTQGNAERLAEIARTEKDLDLKRQAVTMLGVTGEIGLIADMYKTAADPEIRRAMLQGFALAGDGEMLFKLLETETDPETRSAAIHHLIMVDVENLGPKLKKLYENSSSIEDRNALVQVMAMNGEAETLIALYETEKSPEVRRHILQSMAIFMDDPAVADFFESFLKEE
ncbi:MAG TPA: tetratricopeptide repeat protein [Gammaproteobacteria bacterium]